jgi:hypothetical protein
VAQHAPARLRDPPSVRDRQIGLAEVHTVGVDRQRDVEPIIDDQRRAELVAHPTRHSRHPHQLVGLAATGVRLDPHLHDLRRARQRSRQRLVLSVEHRIEPADRRAHARHAPF